MCALGARPAAETPLTDRENDGTELRDISTLIKARRTRAHRQRNPEVTPQMFTAALQGLQRIAVYGASEHGGSIALQHDVCGRQRAMRERRHTFVNRRERSDDRRSKLEQLLA